MQSTIEISHLSREEKLRIMEDIWEDLLKDETGVKSPGWHQEALQTTKLRVDSGQEEIVDWKSAKHDLRKRFECWPGDSLMRFTIRLNKKPPLCGEF